MTGYPNTIRMHDFISYFRKLDNKKGLYAVDLGNLRSKF